MFTGIIEETGQVRTIQKTAASAALTIGGKLIFADLKPGDSVAVNGVCLTARQVSGHTFAADVMRETLNRSALGSLKPGSLLNLERAMPANGRFGGHIVTGHIDGTGTVTAVQQDSNAFLFTIRTEPAVLKYIVEKGSVAVDGISLTVAAVTDAHFSVSVIPHTMRTTVLSERKAGDTVNLENDPLGKYIEKLMVGQSGERRESGITKVFLAKFGFTEGL